MRVLSSRNIWAVYLTAGVTLCALYLFVPPLRGSGPVMNLLGLSPVFAMLAGLRLHRPERRAPWLWFAAGFTLFFLGDVYTYTYRLVFNADVGVPSAGDALYLLFYPVLMVGLIMLVRQRRAGRDRGGKIDAAILTLGLALPSWTLLIWPYLENPAVSLLEESVSIAYPVADIVLLAAAVRLALGGGRRTPAFLLVGSSIVLLLVTDFVFGVLLLQGAFNHQLWLDAGWIGCYVLWGAAALHPSMREIARRGPSGRRVLNQFRLTLLTMASLIAPAIVLVDEIGDGDLGTVIVTVASGILFGLVVLRMAGLVRQRERSASRERMLTTTGAALVAATRRSEIMAVAANAARELIPASMSMIPCSLREQSVVILEDPERPLPTGLAARVTESAEQDGRFRLTAPELTELGLPADQTHGIAVLVPATRSYRGAIVVTAPSRPSAALQEVLGMLANQTALALDREALTRDAHERRSESRLAALVQNTTDLITVVRADGTVEYQSPSILRLLGYTPQEVVGRPFADFVEPSGSGRLLTLLADGFTSASGSRQIVECVLRHRDGSTRQVEILSTDLSADRHVRGIVLNGRDVSERKAFERELTHQAFHDSVTGLPNRSLFIERVSHALMRARRDRHGLAVLFLDLDDFKTINDSLGHAAGDEVLKQVGERLTASIRAADTAARFGGDEFAILLEDLTDRRTASSMARRILELLARPLRVGGKELTIRASIGIAMPGDGVAHDAEELIRNADAAMYTAKRGGKAGSRVFEPAMHEEAVERLELRTDLQQAIAGSQMELHYQPVVRLSDGAAVGVEALLRWNHPERGLVMPDQFIPLAEETGLIVPIGRWVLQEGCRHAVCLQAVPAPGAAPTISINLSLKQLQDSDVVADVRAALAGSGLPPERLMLELTETVLMDDADLAVERLVELKALGVRLALDDFGTGYSSLSYLSRFPVDILKMDRSFLHEGAGPAVDDLAKAVLSLGSAMSLEVVAEGVETEAQRERLRELGCKYGQGYLFAAPMDAESSLGFVTGRSPSGQLIRG